MIKKALVASVAGVLLLLSQPSQAPAAESTAYQQLNLFGDVFELVRARYAAPVDESNLIYSAINGMLAALDPHSAFMDARSYKDMQERTSGEFGGLGLEVRMEEGLVKISRPMEESPALRAGVQAGDTITHIDGQPVLGLTLNEAVEKMRGRVNTPIDLTIKRDGVADPLVVRVIRDVIRTPSVRFRAEGNAAYILITSFTEQTESGVRRAMTELKTQLGDKFEGVILDLRNNPGGLLEQSVAVVDAFLERGEVVSTRGREAGQVQRYTARRGDLADGKPVIVMTNNGSASASEIVAGALQDQKRAIVLGTQTFGKGSVQTIMPMGDQGAMRLTTSRYYTPSGRSIQGTGVTPDVVVEAARIQPLAAGQTTAPTTTANAANTPPQAGPGATTPPDYQLARAVDLMHSLSVYQRAVVTN
jgi:carboxyl-terminal processing protease